VEAKGADGVVLRKDRRFELDRGVRRLDHVVLVCHDGTILQQIELV
jgi:hypothetical protein